MYKTRVSIIVAMDEMGGIGKNNTLLFRIPEDSRRLRELTIGHPLVMGRKTFESLGRLLPNRTHIVVARDSHSLDKLNYKSHFVVASVEEGIEVGRKIEKERLSLRGEILPNPPLRKEGTYRFMEGGTRFSPPLDKGGWGGILQREVFIFGGGQIYAEAMKKDLVDRLYLTIVKGDYSADTFFPEYSGFKKVIFKQDGEWENYEYTFLDLEKEK